MLFIMIRIFDSICSQCSVHYVDNVKCINSRNLCTDISTAEPSLSLTVLLCHHLLVVHSLPRTCIAQKISKMVTVK